MPAEATLVSTGSSHSLPAWIHCQALHKALLQLDLRGGGGKGCEEEKNAHRVTMGTQGILKKKKVLPERRRENWFWLRF